MIEIWPGLILGLLGSAHCVGMCGPLVLALPGSASVRGQGRARFIGTRVVYTLGKTITYMALGVVAGTVGAGFTLAGGQQWLSVALGVVILAGVLVPPRWWGGNVLAGGVTNAMRPLRKVWGRLFGVATYPSLFAIGLLNGLLPCGLVYAAMAGAGATGSITGGTLFMGLFGLGTIPSLLAVAFAGNLLGERFRSGIRKFVPVGVALVAVLLILRGLNLGIPYVSPKMTMEHKVGATEVKMDCCEPK